MNKKENLPYVHMSSEWIILLRVLHTSHHDFQKRGEDDNFLKNTNGHTAMNMK